ncbi:putative methyltransferase PMT2 [Cocos nucifera]|uniref:Putative methyltransferase PMT2 n=1 Tax=Cocos nucifera TaxID=13894 RepID=A0A8K0I986_COCNU|nr:putative methyltransferase PMT2 [Cocos nucifera]
METLCIPRCRFSRITAILQIILGVFVVLISVASIHRYYLAGFLLPSNDEDSRQRFHTIKEGYADFDFKALSERVEDVVSQLLELQDKLDATIQKMDRERKDGGGGAARNMTRSEFRRFLEEEVIQPVYSAHIALRLIRIPKPDDSGLLNSTEDPLINFFTVEETRKYITPKGNKNGKLSKYGTNKTYATIGHACVLMRKELEEYMNYDIGSYYTATTIGIWPRS